jgi:hypothetical protein
VSEVESITYEAEGRAGTTAERSAVQKECRTAATSVETMAVMTAETTAVQIAASMAVPTAASMVV